MMPTLWRRWSGIGGRPKVFDLHAELADARRYERAIDRLHERALFTRMITREQQGVSIASLAAHRTKVARLIATSVTRGEYQLGIGTPRRIRTDGKLRLVYAFGLTDLIVHAVVAEVLDEATAGQASPCLYSYRRGRSWWTAVSAFAAYVRQHARERPDPRSRGLFVLRRDVESYTESIPVGARSPVWSQIWGALGSPEEAGPQMPDRVLVERVVRPEVFVEPGVPGTLLRGVATGQPISCVLFNLYLAPLDRELHLVPGAFYARYADDLLFAHPDRDVVAAHDQVIRHTLDRLQLQYNAAKSRDLYLTRAARPAPGGWGRGVTAVPFLGLEVTATGTVRLDRSKRREFLREVRQRTASTARLLEGATRERVGRSVAAVIARSIDPGEPAVRERSASLLRAAVTDREQLAQVDYQVARTVLEALTGRRGPRGFREVSWRRMREDWGLPSLVHARDRAGGARKAGRAK